MSNFIIEALNNLRDIDIFITDHIGLKYPKLCFKDRDEFICAKPKTALSEMINSNDVTSLAELVYVVVHGRLLDQGLSVYDMYNTVVKGISEIVNTDISKLRIPKIMTDDMLDSRDILNIKNQAEIVNIISSVFGKSKIILLKTMKKDKSTNNPMCYYIQNGTLNLCDRDFIENRTAVYALYPIYVDEKYIRENGLDKKPRGNCGLIPLGQVIVGESVTKPGYYTCLSITSSLIQLQESPYYSDGDEYDQSWLGLT